MQGKGFIRVVAIALAIGCIYSLSFNWVTYTTEKKASAFAKGNTKKYQEYLDSVTNLPVYPVLNFTYGEVREKCLNLGLDLKGGMDVTMEIQLGEMIKNLSDQNPNPAFNKAIQVAYEREKSSQTDYITLFLNAYHELAPSTKLSLLFSTQENSSKITPSSTDKDVENFLRREAKDAFDRSFYILRTRIDQYGVTQPNIQQIKGTDRIQIELPGTQEPERVRKLLQGSAHLEFWRTFDNREAYPVLDNINKTAAAKLKLASAGQTPALDNTKSLKTLSTSGSRPSLIKQGQPGTPSLLSRIKKDSSKAGRAAGGRDSTSRSAFVKQNPLFSQLIPEIYQQPNGQASLAPGPAVGRANRKDTARINELLRSPEARAFIPSNMKLLWDVKANDKTHLFSLYAIRVTRPDGKPELEGDAITDAQADFDPHNNPEVRMVMNNEGANVWRKVSIDASRGTPSDPNDKQAVAIVLDNQVYTAPRVENEIPNGVSSISGSFTIDETKDLANVLKAGRLPAPARIVEESIVGPALGQEAINAGLLSSIVGIIVVVLFMWIYYNRAGAVADLAVLSNVFFIIGVLASLQSVLTLPGIAGIVLTIASSVDANVLIYERIREELAAGKGLRLAISDGFKHAYSSILDSNAATLVLGTILFLIGTGPIKGFATTLLIGIFTSLFAAIFITRLVFESRLNSGKGIDFDRYYTRNAFKNTHFDFLKRRTTFYLLSSVIIGIGIISMFTRGFTLGVDFQGGRTFDIEFSHPLSSAVVRSALKGPLGNEPLVQTISASNRVKVTTNYLVNDNSDEAQRKVLGQLTAGLKKVDPGKFQVLGQRKVGPTIANDIRTKAVYAIIIGITLVFIYILIRFKRWEFGIAAVVALFHDVLILLSLFSIFHGILPFSLEIDQNFIASLLTVMAYSMLDTVVVFDRVRENLGDAGSSSNRMGSVINRALNSTLSRTVITSLTTFTVLLILFVFGGESLRGFSFAMLIGVVFGTYSSVFVATPIVVDLIQKKDEKQSSRIEVKNEVKTVKA